MNAAVSTMPPGLMPCLRAKSTDASTTPAMPPWLAMPPLWISSTPQNGNCAVNFQRRNWSYSRMWPSRPPMTTPAMHQVM